MAELRNGFQGWGMCRKETELGTGLAGGKGIIHAPPRMISGFGDTASSRLAKPSFGKGIMGAVGFVTTKKCGVKCKGKLSRNIGEQSTGGLGEVVNDMFSLLTTFGQRLRQWYIQGSVYHCLFLVFPCEPVFYPLLKKQILSTWPLSYPGVCWGASVWKSSIYSVEQHLLQKGSITIQLRVIIPVFTQESSAIHLGQEKYTYFVKSGPVRAQSPYLQQNLC